MNTELNFLTRWNGWRLLFCAVLATQTFRVAAATYTVTNAADSGPGSLRQAILDANGNPGLDNIVFNLSGIGPFTITPVSALPVITDPVVMDGTTQPRYAGSPLIEINGSSLPAGMVGLYLMAGGSTLSGLAINRCPLDGIRIESLGSNVIQGCFLGTDPTGTLARANGEGGVTINESAGNLIGGTTASARNLISGGNQNGIYLVGSLAAGNIIAGNYIGTSVTGLASLGNVDNGIQITAAPGNIIGGTNAGAGNVISGNQQSGVLIANAGASNNVIEGNFIGPDASGSATLPNGSSGVIIDRAAANAVGGPDGGNVISGNGVDGVDLVDAGGGANTVQANLIGTDSTGEEALGNAQAGIYIEVPGNTIGGPAAGLGNVISGNGQNGLFINGPNASNNLIAGNYIGPDLAGEAALGNGYAGIAIYGAAANTIGGTQAGDRNLISANGQSGINLNGSTTAATVIQGNYIGSDATGTAALANGGGIYLYGSGSNTIGGAVAGAGNLISGNLAEGIFVGNPGANYNVIQGNFIGTQADGFSPLGNQWHNIDLSDTASNNLVGGTSPAADNHIAFVQNPQYDGVRIRAGCLGNLVSRNCIFSNGSLGIVIGPAGLNTANLVTLTEVVSDNVNTLIQGSMNTYANGQFLIQFYQNNVPNPDGYGQGLGFIGLTNITTGADGQASFVLTLPAGVSPGKYLAATATDSTNTTWEFGADVQVQSPPLLNISPSSVGTAQGTVTLNWPTSPPGFILQQTTQLNPPVTWTASTNAVSVEGTTNSIILTPTGQETFYRIQFQ